MARRTLKQLGNDIDQVIRDVWTYHDITWKRTWYFFKELIKVILKNPRNNQRDIR